MNVNLDLVDPDVYPETKPLAARQIAVFGHTQWGRCPCYAYHDREDLVLIAIDKLLSRMAEES